MPDTGHLSDVLALLFAAILVVPILQRIGIAPVLGYLAAGMAIGPFALGLIHDLEATQIVAEFGVVFLLFSIGLELPLSRLRAMRRFIFGLGLAQVVVTTLVLALAAYLLGLPAEAAVLAGGALAMSSTAVVIRMLVERGETATRFGRVSIAVLLFQDLAVVPLLALLPLLQGEASSIPWALGVALAKGIAAIAAVFVLGRLVVRPAYRFIASVGNAEVFTATNIALVLGIGWLTAQAGMSMALGAFLAGLLLADSAYRHQVEADIQPFHGLLLGLFFMTIGMAINLPVIVGDGVRVAALTGGLIAAKVALLFVLCRAFGLTAPAGVRIALTLGQAGEFGFILFGSAMALGLLPADTGQRLLGAVALSMAVTPLLAAAGQAAARRMESRWGTERFGAETSDLRRHVIIAGYGRVGRAVAHVLTEHDIPYVALDLNAQRVADARARKLPVYYGDASQMGVLRAAGVERASAAVITINRPEAAQHAVAALRQADSGLRIIARAHDPAQGAALAELGADAVVPETMEASLQLAGLTLRTQNVEQEAVDAILDRFRSDGYAELDEPARGKSAGTGAGAARSGD